MTTQNNAVAVIAPAPDAIQRQAADRKRIEASLLVLAKEVSGYQADKAKADASIGKAKANSVTDRIGRLAVEAVLAGVADDVKEAVKTGAEKSWQAVKSAWNGPAQLAGSLKASKVPLALPADGWNGSAFVAGGKVIDSIAHDSLSVIAKYQEGDAPLSAYMAVFRTANKRHKEFQKTTAAATEAALIAWLQSDDGKAYLAKHPEVRSASDLRDAMSGEEFEAAKQDGQVILNKVQEAADKANHEQQVRNAYSMLLENLAVLPDDALATLADSVATAIADRAPKVPARRKA